VAEQIPDLLAEQGAELAMRNLLCRLGRWEAMLAHPLAEDLLLAVMHWLAGQLVKGALSGV